jgi:hypothetical protein
MASPPIQKIILKTFRFVLSNEVVECISEFAKVHQYDDRKFFKEEWEKWVKSEDVEPIINDEVKRLKNGGFEGDALDKMFKSARYYFRNKLTQNNDNENDYKIRKTYETVPRNILENIDAHIYSQIRNNTKKYIDDEVQTSDISPGDSFNNYLADNKNVLLNLLQESKNNGQINKKDVEDMVKKYKKTYKNRFYNIRVSLNNN